jgi:hypothetical protein
MAEENKTQEAQVSEAKGQGTLKMLVKVIIGLACIGVALFLLIGWKWYIDLWRVFKGCIGPFLILVGAITIAIARE